MEQEIMGRWQEYVRVIILIPDFNGVATLHRGGGKSKEAHIM